MIEAIGPLSAEERLAQLIGDSNNGNNFLDQAPVVAQAPVFPSATAASAPAARTAFSGNPFDDLLGQAIDKLNGVSRAEVYTNQLIDKYAHGQAELADVMIAQSKLSVLETLAVTTVNTTVSTIKEITQMQV
ncbi:MAG: flagellar hook-basal body complex protein FliE [Candidatus Saganbacteria bacterium]|nr:flagellar hook-basal body complex protein FliE [Candidatus Saganbacteria bacterium]